MGSDRSEYRELPIRNGSLAGCNAPTDSRHQPSYVPIQGFGSSRDLARIPVCSPGLAGVPISLNLWSERTCKSVVNTAITRTVARRRHAWRGPEARHGLKTPLIGFP